LQAIRHLYQMFDRRFLNGDSGSYFR